ncbi:imm11 family protein [Paenibacillus taichungensis]|uniref:imm11 family protein n=1 Tax=Paenibacillus taichungensis TaxID=484184 RepID=UPI003824CC22
MVFECLEESLTDVLPNSGLLLIVSKKVVGILQKICPEDIQIFEANVYIGEKKIPDYYLLNIVSTIEVIDKTESEFTAIKGTDSILNFKKIVYKFDGLPNNHHLVRNLDYKSHVLISDDLKEVFERNNTKGVQFT